METLRVIRSAAEFIAGSFRLVITQIDTVLKYGEDARYRGYGATRLSNRKQNK